MTQFTVKTRPNKTLVATDRSSLSCQTRLALAVEKAKAVG